MSLTSLRDIVTALETRLNERELAFRKMLEQRDEALRATQNRIIALEILTAHLKPRRPVREPVPGPGPGDPPRKNVRRMTRMVTGPDAVGPTATNGAYAVGCVYCGKLLCSSANPLCDRLKQMVRVELDAKGNPKLVTRRR